MKRNLFVVAAIALYSALGLFSACGAVTNAIDCKNICDRYKTCYNKNYDSDACQARCKTKSNNDSNAMQESQACDACLDKNKDCTSTTFACTTQCAGIIP